MNATAFYFELILPVKIMLFAIVACIASFFDGGRDISAVMLVATAILAAIKVFVTVTDFILALKRTDHL